MSKKCCGVRFRSFSPSSSYTELESIIMNLLSISTTKNPRKSAVTIKVLKKQAKDIYDCCNDELKLSHSFGELYEHVKYVNMDNIRDAKKVWTNENKALKK